MLLTVVWSGVVSLIAYKIVDMVIGLRVSEEDEREGLDITVARRDGVPQLTGAGVAGSKGLLSGSADLGGHLRVAFSLGRPESSLRWDDGGRSPSRQRLPCRPGTPYA